MKLFYQVVLFLCIVIFAQLVFVHFFPNTIPQGVIKIDNYIKKNPSIIYFGDSTLTYTSKNDIDKRSTPEILNEVLKGKYSVEMIDSPAWNPDVYLAYSKYINRLKYRPKYVIVPINLRNFSIASDLYPTYQFTDDFTYLALYNTPLSPFLSFITNLIMADVNNKYDYLYKNSIVYDGDKSLGKAEYFENMPNNLPYGERFKNIIIFYYMSKLTPAQRKIKSLVEIEKLFSKNNTKVIFYITPIDYQVAEKYYGKDFKKRIKTNINVIKHALIEKNVEVLDLSFSLPSLHFNWHEGQGGQKYLDEHIDNYGKKYIVDKLSKFIK